MKIAGRIVAIIIAIMLIIGGIILDAVLMKNQNTSILADEAALLNHLAEAIDRNIDVYLEYRIGFLDRERRYSSLENAEKQWIWRGSPDNLTQRLSSDFLEGSDIADDVLVIRNKQIAISVAGNNDLILGEYEYGDRLASCTDADGKIQLVILSEADDFNVQYAFLINVDDFYRNIISSDLASDKWVLLLDSKSQLMIHYQNYHVLTDPIDAVTGATCGPDGIELMKSAQEDQVIVTEDYEYWDADKKLEHVAYLNVIPTNEARNDWFAVGVAGQIDEKTSLIKYTGAGLIVSAVMIAVGLAIILWNYRRYSLKEKERLEEIELLKQKNDEMRLLEEKRSELAHLDRLETIGTLTSSISHEFNNVLTPVMAYSLLSLEKLPESETEIADYLEEIYKSAKRAKIIVSRLSDLSRKNTDKSFAEIDAKELIEKACDSVSPAKPKNIEQHLSLEEGSIYANELQLHQMLLNFILNSYQAMAEKGGVLNIESEFTADNLVIKLSDNGPGIPKENQEKIFDPFFTTKASGLGTGLGLAICKQAAEDHKGLILLDSDSGKGCCFTVLIPRNLNLNND